MVYFVIFFILIFFTYRYDYLGRKAYRLNAYYLVLFLLIVVAGFRYRVGLDTIRYESAFRWLPVLWKLRWNDFADSNYDPLYLILSSFAKSFSSEFWVMQLMQATLVNAVIFSFIKRYTNRIFFATLLYYVFLYLNFMCEVMREACAVSMFLLSWKYFMKEKWPQYYLFCTAAFLFHSSAILLFILPVLKWLRLTELMRMNKYTVVFLLIVLVSGFVIQHYFFDYLNLLAFTGRIEDRINRYSDTDLAGSVLNINGILSTVIQTILYPFIAIICLKRQYNIRSFSIEPMVFLCFTFALLTIPIAIFYRYNNYFMPFAIIAISEIAFQRKVYLFSKGYLHVPRFLLWLLIFAPLFFLKIYGYNTSITGSYLKEYMRYYPYSSIFDKKINQNRETLFIYYNAF